MKTEKDLVWLVSGGSWNGCDYFPTLQEEAPKDVTVNMANGSWTFRGLTTKFGRAVKDPWKGEGTPLGAYDRTDIHHLGTMLDDYRKLVLPPDV